MNSTQFDIEFWTLINRSWLPGEVYAAVIREKDAAAEFFAPDFVAAVSNFAAHAAYNVLHRPKPRSITRGLPVTRVLMRSLIT